MSEGQRIIKFLAVCLAIFIIASIFSGILHLIFFLTDFSGGEEITFNETYTNVEAVKVDVSSAEVSIRKGREFRVEAEGELVNFSSKLQNGTLKIEERKSWFGAGHSTGKIYITVLENTQLNMLDIDAGAGKFTIDGVQARSFDLDEGAGSLEISNSQFFKADIDGGAGAVSIKNSTLHNLDLDAGVGKVDVEAALLGRSRLECGVGELSITLLGREGDYQILGEKGIGKIDINGQEQSGQKIVYGTGPNILNFDGGVGRISINFKPIAVS